MSDPSVDTDRQPAVDAAGGVPRLPGSAASPTADRVEAGNYPTKFDWYLAELNAFEAERERLAFSAKSACSDSCGTCHNEQMIERLATPDEVDAGCELGIAYDPCPDCVVTPNDDACGDDYQAKQIKRPIGRLSQWEEQERITDRGRHVVDFHPEDYCHRCGRPNPSWHSPEWVEVTGSRSGILCPSCFAALAPDAIWKLTRYVTPGTDRTAALAANLRVVTDLGDDADRVARCVLDFLDRDFSTPDNTDSPVPP